MSALLKAWDGSRDRLWAKLCLLPPGCSQWITSEWLRKALLVLAAVGSEILPLTMSSLQFE